MNKPLLICRTLLLTFFISAIFVPNLLAQTSRNQIFKNKSIPTIITEKSNYRADETVIINGTNFLSYERILLSLRSIDNSRQDILLQQWDVFADVSGRISTNFDLSGFDQYGNRFIIEAKGTISGITTKTEVSTLAPTATSVDITQCANGSGPPQNLSCPSAGNTGWISGNVGASKASYYEGDSIAYRNVMRDLVIGNQYKWTVKYDVTKQNLNAIDYLTTYNRTITNANPCDDLPNGASCTLAAVTSTFPIPTDPNVTNGRDLTNGTSDDITQIPGVITAWGATITAVTVPTYTPGTFPTGTVVASVDITFTATATSAVIAWGGHISTRDDWGQAFGSINITGSPYHTSNGGLMNITANTTCCGGSQDLQLSDAAIIATGKIIIIKHATPPSNQQFDFTATPGLTPAAFSLTDNSISTDPSQEFTVSTFNVKTITESNLGGYSLQSINCTVDIGTGGTPAPVRNGNSIAIDIKSGDQVTCTFNNDIITAAGASITGRAVRANGLGIKGAVITMTNNNGYSRTVRTNSLGYYKFDDVEVGQAYLFDIRHKSYRFNSRVINVGEDLTGQDFIAN
jgi:hypothetical protein